MDEKINKNIRYAASAEERTTIYASEVFTAAPRLLGLLDREAYSISYGSFDREHWGWKFRDFPITMLQTAVCPLAMLWRYPLPGNLYYQNGQVLNWIEGVINNTCDRQHTNGAFDSVGPYTQDHGVTLAMVFALTEAGRLLGDALTPSLHDRITEVVRKGCAFALRSREDYAFISNHQALFALAYLNAAEWVGDHTYRQQADQIIENIITQQSSDGWYREYEGPDPGYETLGISQLVAYWLRTGSVRLLESLRRSVAFFAHCVHPDGSVGGVYGSRHTSLYYPSGFEILASEIPEAAAVARFMRSRLMDRNVVTPSTADAENLPSLTYSYLNACFAPNSADVHSTLPFETLRGVHTFEDAGIVVAGTDRYYAVLNMSKGGVCRIFDTARERLVYEDAGYLVEAGRRRWTSQHIGLGRPLKTQRAAEVICTTTFSEVLQELPTPFKYILLRLSNLTLFRNLALGSWLRRLIISRIITSRRLGPLRLKRSVRFEENAVYFEDHLELLRDIKVKTVVLPRSFTTIHMGSAKYFHPSELETVPAAPVSRIRHELTRSRSAACSFSLHFLHGSVTLHRDDRGKHHSSTSTLLVQA